MSERGTPSLLSIVVPAHNESAVLPELFAELANVAEKLGVAHETIVVDDGSTDATWQMLRSRADTDRRLRAVRLSRQFGKEAALCAGLALARGSAVVVMDSDLQHPPSLIPQMLDAWRAGADIVDAVKVERGDQRAAESWRARVFYALFKALSGQDISNASDFKLLDRRVLDAYLALNERNVFFRGMTAWLGFKRSTVEFAVPPRRAGSTQWSLGRLVRLAITAVTSFSSAPLHIVTLLGACFLAFSLVLGAQTLYRKLTGTALDGFTTVILVLLITGSALMIGLGIIGEYVARIYDEVKGRPRYVVREHIGERDAH